MKRRFHIGLVAVLFVFRINAQVFEITNDPVFKSKTGKVFSLALAGGLNQPQFSNFDFNRDGVQDLFVFERDGSQRFAFINETKNGVIRYRYEPNFDEYFPTATEFMLFRDFNGDGESDLLIGNSRGGLHYMQGKNNPAKVSVEMQKTKPSVRVYPNPTGGSISIETTLASPVACSITNLKGQLLQQGILSSDGLLKLNSELSNGIYFITLSNESATLTPQKIVVAK